VSIADNTVILTVQNVTYTTTQLIYNIPMFFSKSYAPATKGNVTIYLSEKLFDFTKPIKVIVNGNETFNGKVTPTIKAMAESCVEFFDPERVFPAEITVDIK
jgi:hypothetical protein